MRSNSLIKKYLLIISSLLIGFVSIVVFWIIPNLGNKINSLEEKNALEVLDKITLISNYVQEDIELYEKLSLQRDQSELKNNVNLIIQSYFQPNSFKQNAIINKIDTLRYGSNGYFWINDLNGNMIIHPFLKELNGKNVLNFKDSHGNYLFQDFIKTAKEKGEGYVQYYWPKPNEPKAKKKLSFVKLIPNTNWIIGTGVYIDDVKHRVELKTQELRDKILEIIKSTKVGENGYFAIFDSKGTLIFHPESSFVGKSLQNIQVPHQEISFFDLFINEYKKGKRKFYYFWNTPTDKENFIYEKIAWMEYVDKLDWYIMPTAYVKDYQTTSHQVTSHLTIVSFVFLILTLIICYFLISDTLKPILQLARDAKKVTNGNYAVRSTINRDDEIGTLAYAFNRMVQTIEDNVKNLEYKIKVELDKNKQVQEQLFRSEKLASMGEMIGNIAHQWRQPLAIISTAAMGIKLKKDFGNLSDEFIDESCDAINKNSKYLSTTIDDFKNFIKENKRKEKFFLADMIESLEHLIASSIKKYDIQLIKNIHDDKILSFQNEITQVLINIFNNSKDAFEINNIQNRYFFITCLVSDNHLIIETQDSAGGIPESIIQKIFEPYFTTKHKSQGTGLGLHMTHKIITEGLQGTIQVENKELSFEEKTFSGARFTINIPLEEIS